VTTSLLLPPPPPESPEGLGLGGDDGSGDGLVEGSGVAEKGVIGVDAKDAELLPSAFRAVTVNVYGVRSVRPLTVHESAAALGGSQVNPPGELVTV
jgi:hypothetical protein